MNVGHPRNRINIYTTELIPTEKLFYSTVKQKNVRDIMIICMHSIMFDIFHIVLALEMYGHAFIVQKTSTPDLVLWRLGDPTRVHIIIRAGRVPPPQQIILDP